MFALEVEYLTGRAVASARDDRDSAEWPPHPGRLFMALVAAHAERDSNDEAENAALAWLESLRPPEISATGASYRVVLDVYVPVNDNFGPDKVPRGGFSPTVVADRIRVLPERRSKQARTFPSVTPDSPQVYFTWRDTEPEEVATHREAMQRLAANVTYLGHSSSLVRVAVCDMPPPATLLPSEEGTIALRVPTPGRLAELVSSYRAQQPTSAGFYSGYIEVKRDEPYNIPSSTLGLPLTFRLEGPSLPLTASERLTTAIRDAWMKLSESQPPPESLSGHGPDNSPTQYDHVAILPLAFVGHRHADGLIRGFAAVIPQTVQGRQRVEVLRALGRLKEIWLGPLGRWIVERLVSEPTLHSLRWGPYIGPSRGWETVTPVVFDRFPKMAPGRDATSLIARACIRIGLPEPAWVEVSHVSRVLGAPTSPEFTPRVKPGMARRPFAHVSIHFDKPVRGPVVLGAGRYRGLGLFRAMDLPTV